MLISESMNKLDPKNVPQSLDTIEGYIRYMTERLNFTIEQQQRRIAALEAEVKKK